MTLCPCKLQAMPPTHPSQAAVAAAYRTLIAHETAPKEQDFYRDRLQRLEQATEPECELDCRNRVAAAGVGVYCPPCSAKCADTDLTTRLAKAIRAAWVDRLDWDELAHAALKFLTSTGRLIPAGGMALTAEQVEDVRRLIRAVRKSGVGVPIADRLESALFPATEPAEKRCPTCDDTGDVHRLDGEWLGVCDCPIGTPSPAPAVSHDGSACADKARGNTPPRHDPETGMTSITVHRACNRCGRDLGDATEKELDACVDGTPLPDVHDECGCASSPVVPAPTETGPWPTWQEVPEGVKYYGINGWGPTYYVNRDGVRYRVFDDTPSKTADYVVQNFAPFVAAERG